MLQNEFDDILKRKLEDAAIAPPNDLWNKIEMQLPKKTSIFEKYKYLLLGLLIFSSSISSVFVYENYLRDSIVHPLTAKKETNTIPNNNKIKNNQSITKIKQSENNSTTKSEQILAHHHQKKNSPISSNLSSTNNKEATEINTQILHPSTSKVINTQSEYLNQQIKKQTVEKQNKLSKYKTPNTNSEQIVVNNKKKVEYSKQNKVNSELYANNNEQENATLKYKKTKNKHKNNSEEVAMLNTIAYEEIVNNLKIAEEKNWIASIDQIPISQVSAPSYTTAEILKSFYPEENFEENNQVALTEYEKQKEKQLKNLKEFSGIDVTKGFHAGVLMSIHNNWLTSKNKNKEDDANVIKHKIDFGKSFGLNLGYDYTSRWGIQTEIAYNEQGQKYVETTTDNQTLNKELDLAYLRIPLMLKYKINFINNYNTKPVILNFLFGPQVNLLLTKKTMINDKNQTFDAAYNRGEFGLYGGVDFDLFLTKNFYMTFGTRMGFATAMKKESPKSFQIGITTQFNFKKPTKIKK